MVLCGYDLFHIFNEICVDDGREGMWCGKSRMVFEVYEESASQCARRDDKVYSRYINAYRY